ncbi:MAG: hypothetical protein KDC38_14300 [Planctomycetes bacterium]|nr:hypothetical protein [Planctomycetota bacterium]
MKDSKTLGFVGGWALLGVLALGWVGCSGPAPRSDSGTAPKSGTTDMSSSATTADDTSSDPRFEGAASAKAMQGGADDLVREMGLAGQERLAASQAATREAERLVSELRYQDAQDKLEQALRLDPNNEKARELLDRVHFIVGDRSGLQDVARQAASEERVARQQSILEMERMYLDGRREMEDGQYDDAVRTFDRLLERIAWFPYNNDLTDLRTRAQNSKGEADAAAQRESLSRRVELERQVREDSEAQQRRSLQFVKNRIEKLMDRSRIAFRGKEYDEVVGLTEQVLDLDPANVEARRLRNKSAELRDLYRELQIAERHDREWRSTIMSQRNSEIPYAAVFNFPDRDDWKQISHKALSVTDRAIGEASTQDAAIELKLQKPVDVEFDDQPFSDVMDFLQNVSDVNFVLTKEARDALESDDSPVRLAKVRGLPLRNVLNLVLETRDPKFAYRIKSGAVMIGPADSVREDLHLEFYPVNDLIKSPPDFLAPKLALDEEEGGGGGGGGGAGSILNLGDDDDTTGAATLDAELLKELVEKLLGGEGEEMEEGESADIQNGKLVVRTTLAEHQKLVELLTALRKNTGIMVTVESRFIDLQDNFLQSVGINFGNPFSSNLPNPINDIDGNGTQISPGYEFVDAQGQTDVRAAVFNSFSQPLGSQVAPFQLSNAGGFALQYNVLDTYILEAILEANAKEQRFKQLDAPRVTAFNGQISHSLVVDQSAYIKDAEVNQTGVIPVINPVIGILNSGSILQVRPTVSHDRKYVILEIEPTLAVRLPSRFKNLTLNLTNLNVEFPVLNVTKIKTTVTVPDGGTVLVGGLKRTITQKQHVGVPWLADLPGLNLLFGRKGESRLMSNLFVLLNAQITVIRDEEAALYN